MGYICMTVEYSLDVIFHLALWIFPPLLRLITLTKQEIKITSEIWFDICECIYCCIARMPCKGKHTMLTLTHQISTWGSVKILIFLYFSGLGGFFGLKKCFFAFIFLFSLSTTLFSICFLFSKVCLRNIRNLPVQQWKQGDNLVLKSKSGNKNKKHFLNIPLFCCVLC